MIPWLYGLRHLGIKLGLDNIRGLLGELEHPERAFRSVHVAGTNGKGSVAAMIDALLAAAGVASGMFTSPHLVRPHERIRLAGRDIADDELQRRLSEMRRTIETGLAESRLEVHPSFFEVMTATALQAFKDHGLEAAALEVGLGGRLDATNAVPADVAVVVSIALDHMKTLGGTLEKIAFEKAGIIKRGQPVVSGVAQQRAIDVLRTVCLERGARWIDARLAARLVSEDHGSFTLESDHARYPDLRLPLAGRHQIDNARIALTAFELLMERLGRRPEPGAVQAGFASVRWPGRVQWVEPEEGGPRLLLDAAHNPAGLQTLTSYLREQGLTSLVMLFSATTGKPVPSTPRKSRNSPGPSFLGSTCGPTSPPASNAPAIWPVPTASCWSRDRSTWWARCWACSRARPPPAPSPCDGASSTQKSDPGSGYRCEPGI
jgi:dihydrofolate synthase/folylpolyglutamate synthase